MQAYRLFKIIYLLLDKSPITAGELAEQLEVSKRTILRNIDKLSSAGIPVYSKQGHSGGICLMEGFSLSKSLLSESEKSDLLTALGILDSLGTLSDDSLLKFRSIFNKQPTDWIDIDFSHWGDNGSQSSTFSMIRDAIVSSSIISFSYIDSNGSESTRSVNPVKVIFKHSSWYLAGYCHSRKDMRVFKINRISDARIKDEYFDSSEFKYEAPFDETPENSIDVSLFVPGELAYRIYDEFDRCSITPLENGLMVKFKAMENTWLYNYIASFGGKARVLAPESLNKQVEEWLIETLANYTSQT